MTCREKLKKEHPELVRDGACGGCVGCPDDYGYLDRKDTECPRKRMGDGDRCATCWSKEIPEDNITPQTGFIVFRDGHIEDMISVEVFDDEVLFRTKWNAYKYEKNNNSKCRFYILCYQVEDGAEFYEVIDTIDYIEYVLGDGTRIRYNACPNREIPEDVVDKLVEVGLPNPVSAAELASVIKDSGDRTQFSTGAVRDMHEGKGDMASVPWEAILRLSKHYENGAKKYERWNFRKGIPVSSFIDSAMRHLAKYQCGCDDEDHLAAAAFNVLGAMLMENTMPEMQDLPLREGKNTFDYFKKI